MRKTAILVLLLFSAPMVPAQTRATVDDMERLLASLQKQDDESVASRLSGVELTERVSFARLTRWQSMLRGGQSRIALLALADASAFEPLPAADLTANLPPDEAAQTAILGRSAEYVTNLRPRLPNFTATHTATRFQVSTREEIAADERNLQFQQMSHAKLRYRTLGPAGAKARNLYLAGTTTSTVTFRDGAEVRSPASSGGKDEPLVPNGLMSFGEFGPILLVVNSDASHGHIEWDHWEKGPDTQLAVFRYHVPKDQSHFATYSPDPAFPGIAPKPHYPAYHGEIAIDPADGSILRITILADSDPNGPAAAGIAVEYAGVPIGGRTYICPVHAAAVSTQETSAPAAAHPAQPQLRKYINDVSFTNYHVFRSDARVIPDTPGKP
jgi:hypothetical protein